MKNKRYILILFVLLLGVDIPGNIQSDTVRSNKKSSDSIIVSDSIAVKDTVKHCIPCYEDTLSVLSESIKAEYTKSVELNKSIKEIIKKNRENIQAMELMLNNCAETKEFKIKVPEPEKNTNNIVPVINVRKKNDKQ